MAQNNTTTDKIISLYGYIREFSKLKQHITQNTDECLYYLPISKIPNNPEYVSISYRDNADNEILNATEYLLKIQKPEFQKCPQPDSKLHEWLNSDWDNYEKNVKVTESIVRKIDVVEKFTDDANRVKMYDNWIALRKQWQEKQKLINATRQLFTKLYQTHTDLDRESETLEFVPPQVLYVIKTILT